MLKYVLMCVLLNCVLPCMQLCAQSTHLRFEHYTPEDGLSQAQAYTIYQDHEGYLWIGTQDGLNRFDGYEFKVYRSNPFDSTSLPHNWIWTVTEDARGNLWVGTFGGLCRYVREQDRFVQYFNDPDNTASISGNRPNSMVLDKKGQLWVSSWGRGINRYDENTDSFVHYEHDVNNLNSLSDNFVRTLHVDNDGTIWAGTWNGGLNKMIVKDNKVSFLRYDAIKEYGFAGGNRITSLEDDSEGNLWIASYESGLLILNKTTNSIFRFPNFGSNEVNRIFRDSKGSMWIGTMNSGLFNYQTSDHSLVNYTHDPDDPSSLRSNTVYSIFEDHQHNLWVSGSGVSKYDPHKNVFKVFRNKPNDPTTLSQNHVWTFCEDDEGLVWIGVESGPLSVFNPKTEKFRQVVIRDKQGNLATNIHKIAWDKGNFWMASYSSGLIRYNKESGSSTFYYHQAGGSKLSETVLINDILVDGDLLWIATNENGLFKMNIVTEQIDQFVFNPDDPTSIGSNYVNVLYADKQHRIWMGFWGGGVSVMDPSTKKFTTYHYNPKDPTSLSNSIVSGIVQENDSIFWFATQGGLNRLNTNTQIFSHYFQKDGLSSDVTYDIKKARNGVLWISSNGGIIRYDPKEKIFRSYTQADGLQGNEFNSGASMLSSTGWMYFGGTNGFNMFHPDSIQVNSKPVKVVIHSLRVMDTRVPVAKELEVPFDKNDFSVKFGSIEFSAPEKLKYAYRLDGFDKDWNYVNDRREAFYTNLDPGHYVFKLKTANADGFWSEEQPQFAIVINPPFWKTWWFMTLGVLAISTVAYAMHRYRLQQSLKVERLRNKIASDLHDEVGSSLTRISIYSELLQNGVEEKEKKSYLKNISALSREVVSTMSDIVWSIDNQNDKLGALIFRMKDFAMEVLQAKHIDVRFTIHEVDENKSLDPAIQQNLYLIFKESINNIVKHAGASEVTIDLYQNSKSFKMSIHDNGVGIRPDTPSTGHGLRNMQRRAEAIKALFVIENAKGTTISVERNSI